MTDKAYLFVPSVFAAIFFGWAFFAHAAAITLYIEARASSVVVGTTFQVKILLNSDQPVNAYAVKLSYSPALLDLLGTNTAHSLVTVTQGNPLVIQGGEITWNGGSVKPFIGNGGELLMLNLKAVATGTAEVTLHDSFVYLANGKGTKITPSLKNLKLSIAPAPKGNATSSRFAQEENVDVAPPEISYLSFIVNPFDASQKLLGFFVVDPGSGVKENSVRYRSGLFWSAWQPARNPMPLPVNAWEVDFRATDNAGNTAFVTAYDWGAIWSGLLPELALALGVAAAGCFFVVRFMKKRRGSGGSNGNNPTK